MKRKSEDQDDLLYQLAVALLELIDKPIDIELEQTGSPHGLVLNGTLLRAFDTPASAAPSLSVMIGAHITTIRIAPIHRIAIQRTNDKPNPLHSIHLLLTDGFSLHIKSQDHKFHLQSPL